MGRARRYTDEQFLEALADPAVTTIAALCRRLGVVPRGGNYATLRALARELDVTLPSPHSVEPGPSGRPVDTICDAETARAVADARSLAAALRALGATVSDANRDWLKDAIQRLGLSTTHFVGPARGPDGGHPGENSRAKPLRATLVLGVAASSAKLRRRLISEGVLPRRCSRCERTRWEDQPIPLELDHINGDRFDNRLRNLRLLCPNCHALTPTYRGRNIGKGS